MKVFFGGSWPGFNKNKKDYIAVRQTILDLKHIITRDWVKQELSGKTKVTPNQMFELTKRAIKNSDAVILDWTFRESNVGQQRLVALEYGIPTLLLVKSSSGEKDSPLVDNFIDSGYEKYIRKTDYNNGNLRDIIEDFLAWVGQNKKIVRFNLEIDKQMDEYLKKVAGKNRTSKAEEIRKLIAGGMKESP